MEWGDGSPDAVPARTIFDRMPATTRDPGTPRSSGTSRNTDLVVLTATSLTDLGSTSWDRRNLRRPAPPNPTTSPLTSAFSLGTGEVRSRRRHPPVGPRGDGARSPADNLFFPGAGPVADWRTGLPAANQKGWLGNASLEFYRPEAPGLRPRSWNFGEERGATSAIEEVVRVVGREISYARQAATGGPRLDRAGGTPCRRRAGRRCEHGVPQLVSSCSPHC